MSKFYKHGFFTSKLENKSSFENRATNGLRIQPGMIQNPKLNQTVIGYYIGGCGGSRCGGGGCGGGGALDVGMSGDGEFLCVYLT